MTFDPEVFVADCRAAAGEGDAPTAVAEVLAAATDDGSSIDAALGAEYKREADVLFSSPNLTVQRILWPRGAVTSPHDHRMWAVVGVYGGEETNRLYKRSSEGLNECGGQSVAQGDVFVLGADAIHSVENAGSGWTAALHVYGGDILTVERSAWGPDGREVPYGEMTSAVKAMLQSAYDLAEERGAAIDDQALSVAITALLAWCKLERRYATPAEARGIVTDAWELLS
jgi:predicted metal-dependent enzyme (double-stranded beta helix superfamily)